MIWDPLVYWLSHMGQGSWASFKRGVTSQAGTDLDAKAEARRLRVRFSELAFAEFFVDGTDRWRTFAPILVSSPHLPGEALLCGGRTPFLINTLKHAAERHGCRCFPAVVDGFTNLKVHGHNIGQAATAAGIRFEPDVGRLLATQLKPLDITVSEAPKQVPPSAWSVRSFDLTKQRWVEGLVAKTATEYTSRYQERAYFIELVHNEIHRLGKRDAVFAAAAASGVRLAGYDAEVHELWTVADAPLPEPHTRALCLAGGQASTLRGARIIYEKVPPWLAGVVLGALKQPLPPFHLCDDRNHRKARR